MRWGVLKVYPGGAQRRLEGPYNWAKAQAEARLLRGMMMHGTAPSKGIFVVDYHAEAAAMGQPSLGGPLFSEYPYSEVHR